jgi:putative acetyltransferase
MRIIEDDLCGPEIAKLLTEHLAAMVRNSPPQCVHALDLAALRAPDITFWTAWSNSTLLGCAALKELDPTHGEIKSMRTAEAFLGQGVGSAMLSHLIDVAVSRSYSRLSLETGSGPAFAPALALYEKFGFEYCGPFANYRADPFTRFMTMEL